MNRLNVELNSNVNNINKSLFSSVIDSQAEEASSNRHEGLCGNIDLEQYNRYNDVSDLYILYI